VLLTDESPTSARGSGSSAAHRVGWTLMAANNRSLGRSAALYPSIEAARAAVDGLRRLVSETRLSVFTRDQERGLRPYWTWLLLSDNNPVAVSAFRYARRFEAEESGQRFLGAVPLAAAGEPAVLRIGERIVGGRQ